MIEARSFCAELLGRGYRVVSGVPCSFFQGPIALLSAEEGAEYLPAPNEGAALATVAGAVLAGARGAVIAQNSGFGNLVNPLTSLCIPYRIGCLVFMSLRGDPAGEPDEAQHEVMGRSTLALLDLLGVRHWTLDPGTGPEALPGVLDRAEEETANGRTAFVLVRKGTIGTLETGPDGGAVGHAGPAGDGGPDGDGGPAGMDREEAVSAVLGRLTDQHLFSTTGFISRQVFALGDRPRNFYMQGSMGHVLALGLGFAVSNPDRRVVVLDGDGAALMHLGTMSMVGHRAPANLLHVILDNEAYESTGNQASTSSTTRLEEVASACGYAFAGRADDRPSLDGLLDRALGARGPGLVLAKVRPTEGRVPPRPSAHLPLTEVRRRFGESVHA